MDLHLIDQQKYPDAKCLDGSPAGFYHQKGEGEGANKYLIFFQGGSACFGLTKNIMLYNCYKRSKTLLGSSKDWESQIDGTGIMQSSVEINPDFHNWTKIFIPYCDGLTHQGYRKDPIKVLGQNLYFKGLSTTQATFEVLVNEFNLSSDSLTDVLLTGTSAGGLATFYYADYVKDLLSKNTRYWAASDSGFFINFFKNDPYQIFNKFLLSMLEIIDRQQVLPLGCPTINDDQRVQECVMPVYIAPRVKSDLYIFMSAYDEFNVDTFMGVRCIDHHSMQNCKPKTQEQLQEFRLEMISEITSALNQKKNSNAWIVSCINHGYLYRNEFFNYNKYQVPAHSGNTPQSALYQWMYSSMEERKNSIDKVDWPYNEPCNGYEHLRSSKIEESEFLQDYLDFITPVPEEITILE